MCPNYLARGYQVLHAKQANKNYKYCKTIFHVLDDFKLALESKQNYNCIISEIATYYELNCYILHYNTHIAIAVC